MNPGTLYIIATPIGNLEDITLRALRILKDVYVVFCEDTRTTKILFDKYDIRTPRESLNAITEGGKAKRVAELLRSGKDVAYVSDAGTPGISDPGSILVARVRVEIPDAPIVPIPGASALPTALSAAGVPTHEFTFYGFLPHKKGRKTLFEEIIKSERTAIFYESPHRILKALESLKGSNKTITIARELTKIYEEFVSGTAEEISLYFEKNKDKVRGEFVVIVSTALK